MIKAGLEPVDQDFPRREWIEYCLSGERDITRS